MLDAYFDASRRARDRERTSLARHRAKNLLKKAGYDSLYETHGSKKKGEGDRRHAWAAFEPEQVRRTGTRKKYGDAPAAPAAPAPVAAAPAVAPAVEKPRSRKATQLRTQAEALRGSVAEAKALEKERTKGMTSADLGRDPSVGQVARENALREREIRAARRVGSGGRSGSREEAGSPEGGPGGSSGSRQAPQERAGLPGQQAQRLGPQGSQVGREAAPVLRHGGGRGRGRYALYGRQGRPDPSTKKWVVEIPSEATAAPKAEPEPTLRSPPRRKRSSADRQGREQKVWASWPRGCPSRRLWRRSRGLPGST